MCYAFQSQINSMKRTIPWSEEEDDSSSDESSSQHSDSGAEDGVDKKKAKEKTWKGIHDID